MNARYVDLCCKCFQPVNKCICGNHSSFQCDRGIEEVIRNLNLKGYKTTHCCSGHPDLLGYEGYIAFANHYDLIPPTDRIKTEIFRGQFFFRWGEDKKIVKKIKSDSALLLYRTDLYLQDMTALLEWSKDLPYIS